MIPQTGTMGNAKRNVFLPGFCNALWALQKVYFYKGFCDFRVSFENEILILLWNGRYEAVFIV